MKKSESSGKISSDDRAPLEYWVPVVVHPSHLEGLVGAHPGVAKVLFRPGCELICFEGGRQRGAGAWPGWCRAQGLYHTAG